MLPRAEGRVEQLAAADKITALIELISAGNQSLRILSDELEPEIFDDEALVKAISALARRHRDSRIKILLKSTRLVVKRRHRLVALQKRMPTLIQIRRLTHLPESHIENYVVVDETGIFFDPRDDDKVCFSNVDDRPFAHHLLLRFEELWQVSSADPELRSLPL